MMEISMKNFDYITNPAKLLTPEIVQMVGSIHEHKDSLFNMKVWMKLLVKKKGPYPFWI